VCTPEHVHGCWLRLLRRDQVAITAVMSACSASFSL